MSTLTTILAIFLSLIFGITWLFLVAYVIEKYNK
jgi:hypothetical protein